MLILFSSTSFTCTHSHSFIKVILVWLLQDSTLLFLSKKDIYWLPTDVMDLIIFQIALKISEKYIYIFKLFEIIEYFKFKLTHNSIVFPVYTVKDWLLNILGNDMYPLLYSKLLSFSGSQGVSKCLVWEIHQQKYDIF